jgi:hypothetical protein
VTEADEGPVGDEDFNGAVLRNIYEVFLEPEVAARGGREVVGPIRKGVVLLEPGAGVRVLLNDEAEVVATVRATRAIAAGEEIREADFDLVQDLRPETVPEDAGWVALAVLPLARISAQLVRGKGLGEFVVEGAVAPPGDGGVGEVGLAEDWRVGPSVEADGDGVGGGGDLAGGFEEAALQGVGGDGGVAG